MSSTTLPTNGMSSTTVPTNAVHLPLTALATGECGRVVGVAGDLGACRRLADLGFTAETPVECLRRAPLGSPMVYCVGESELCLRGDLAACVLVERTA